MQATLSEHGDMLSTRELADYLGISVWTLYKWNQRGTGPRRVMVGGRCLYLREAVTTWLAEQVVA